MSIVLPDRLRGIATRVSETSVRAVARFLGIFFSPLDNLRRMQLSSEQIRDRARILRMYGHYSLAEVYDAEAERVAYVESQTTHAASLSQMLQIARSAPERLWTCVDSAGQQVALKIHRDRTMSLQMFDRLIYGPQSWVPAKIPQLAWPVSMTREEA